MLHTVKSYANQTGMKMATNNKNHMLTVASLKQKMVVLKFQLEKLYTNNKQILTQWDFLTTEVQICIAS